MRITEEYKQKFKSDIIRTFMEEKEIRKIVLFGSFNSEDNIDDIDIAIFQDSNESYLSLALKYRKLARDLAKIIPLDILPLKSGVKDSSFLSEIDTGEVIFER